MKNFLQLHAIVRLALLFMGLFSVILQFHTASLGFRHYRYSRSQRAREVSMALLTLVSAMIAVFLHIHLPFVAMPPRWIREALLLFPLCLIPFSAAAFLQTPVLSSIEISSVALCVLFFRNVPSAIVPILLFCAVRAVLVFAAVWRDRQRELSNDSVQEALDQIPMGILFCDTGGRPLLANHRIMDLCEELTGSALVNGNLFRRDLEDFAGREGVEKIMMEDSMLFRTPRGAFSFLIWSTTLKQRNGFLMLAFDATEKDRLVRELRQIREALTRQGDSLRLLAQDLEEVTRRQELMQLEQQIHDMTGYRLYLLQQYLRTHDTDADLQAFQSFRPLVEGLLEDIEHEQPLSAEKILQSLARSFAFIGVTLNLVGALPSKSRQASVLIKVLRECATNAVKHAGASEITARISCAGDWLVMDVTNNGAPFAGESVTEHQGLCGMRELVQKEGGTLQVRPHPRFTVSVSLPA